MFENINQFLNFKTICQQENIAYHTYTISSEETTTVVLKGLIKFPENEICNSVKTGVKCYIYS